MKSTTRLDYLVSKLNLNSVQFDMLPGGGEPDLDAMMVHAALGMGQGKLSKEAYLLGRAVYQYDYAHWLAMRTLGAEHIHAMFVANNWSFTKPYASHLNRLRDELGFDVRQIGEARYKLAKEMPLLLAQLAISEVENNGNCMTCRGTGRTRNYTDCKPCGGSGKRPMNERYKADFVLIDDGNGNAYKQWHRTWKDRYAQIFRMFSTWETEFFDHLVRYCG
jgi:hypothetical protein